MSPRDRVVAILRDPVSRAVSMFNYVDEFVRINPDGPHSRWFLAAGFAPGDFTGSLAAFTANEQCYLLGGRPRCANALHVLRVVRCTPSLMGGLGRVYADLFGVAPPDGVNASPPKLRVEDLSRATRAAILERNAEDVALIAAVEAARPGVPLGRPFLRRWFGWPSWMRRRAAAGGHVD